MTSKTMRRLFIKDPDGTRRPLLDAEAYASFIPPMYQGIEYPSWIDKPKGRRVELNAMTPREFETWVEYNLEKHGVPFDEARTAFLDENAIEFFDPDHSEGEDRFLLLGLSFKLRVVIVCHCFRESDLVVRIISARKADREEEGEYWRRR